MKASENILRSSGFSLGRRTLLAQSPWMSEFWDETSLPAMVRGPVDFIALRRLASSCFCEMGMGVFLSLLLKRFEKPC